MHVSDAQATARLLADSGFRLARIGINWDSLSYEDPTRFANEANIRARLTALQRHGLRPLILLDANSLGPAPARQLTLTTLAAASAGARSVTLAPASAAQVVPGKTGFDQLPFGGNPDILVTSVQPNGVARLSMPLPSARRPANTRARHCCTRRFSRPCSPTANRTRSSQKRSPAG